MRIYKVRFLDPFDHVLRERYFSRKADAVRFKDRIRSDRPFPVREWEGQVLKDGEWTPIQL